MSSKLPPRWVRVVHLVNACAFFVMLFSGWQVYNADPFLIKELPSTLALGGSLPGALLWHFAAMWVLASNGIVTAALLLATGRLCRLYLSIRLRDMPAQLRGFLKAPLTHQEDERHLVQKIAYLGVLLLLSTEVLSGLALWKPVQLRWLADGLFGGYDAVRHVHFVGMSMLGLFAISHVSLALSSPRLLLAMLGIRRRSAPPKETFF